jgi:hypothetical protein
MRRLARLAILFVSILALQLNALEGGAACLLAASSGQMGVVDATMAAMDMGAEQRGSHSPERSPCHQSGGPHASCQSMTQCAAIFAVIQAAVGNASVSGPAGRIALVAIVPSSRSLSPDVPPPKA